MPDTSTGPEVPQSERPGGSGSTVADASPGNSFQPVTTNAHVVLLSEDASLQHWLQQMRPKSLSVVTRTMLLNADWQMSRDRHLRMALPEKVRVIMELPKMRTATGVRNDRKVLDRATTYCEQDGVFALFAPRRSDTWEMQAVQKVTQMPGTYTTIHHSCAWGMTVHNGLPMRMLFKLVTNRPCQDTPCPHRASVRHDTDHRYLIVTSTDALTDRRLDNHTAMMGHMLHLAIGADLTYLTLSPESNTSATSPTT